MPDHATATLEQDMILPSEGDLPPGTEPPDSRSPDGATLFTFNNLPDALNQ